MEYYGFFGTTKYCFDGDISWSGQLLGNHMDVQGLGRGGPAPHWLRCFGELISSLTKAALGRASPAQWS